MKNRVFRYSWSSEAGNATFCMKNWFTWRTNSRISIGNQWNILISFNTIWTYKKSWHKIMIGLKYLVSCHFEIFHTFVIAHKQLKKYFKFEWIFLKWFFYKLNNLLWKELQDRLWCLIQSQLILNQLLGFHFLVLPMS